MFFDFIYDLMGGWNQWGQDFGYMLFDLVGLLFGWEKAERWFT